MKFEGYELCDIGAFPEPPLSGKITQRVTEAWKQPQNEKEQKSVEKMWDLVNRLKKQKEK